MPRRVLLFGSTGQVARALARAEWAPDIELIALDRAAADLSDVERLPAIVHRHRPDTVIIAAAYTAVDRAESEEVLATKVNAHGPAAIALAAAECGASIMHISTDYVFDGEKAGFYSETDAPRPLSSYGRSKLAGEEGVRQGNPKHLILRTSWVFSATGSGFFNAMLRVAATSGEARVVAGQVACPTSASDLADAIIRLVPVALNERTAWGIYHLAGRTEATRPVFAEAIFDGLARRGLRRPRIVCVAPEDYPTPARRPLNSRLSSKLIDETFGVRLRGWESALPDVLDAVLAPA